MNTAYNRYVKHWLEFLQAEDVDPKAFDDTFDQLSRVMDKLCEKTDMAFSEKECEEAILDLTLSADKLLEYHGLIETNINWIRRALEAAQYLEKPALIGRLGQDLGWCYR